MAQTHLGVPESTLNIVQDRRVRDVSRRIAYLDPDVAPLLQVTSRAKNRAATNTKFEWIEKELADRWSAINDATPPNATDTTITVDNGSIFNAGDLVKVPRTGEVFRVVSISTNDLTVVRAVDGDGTTGVQTADDDDLLILGNAFREGSLSAVEKSHPETYLYNYTQILKKSFGVTGSEMASENYTGPDRPRLRAEKAIEHKIDMERTALFGERAIFSTGDSDATTNNPRRYTGGFFYYVTTNATNANGILTEPELESFCQTLFQHTASGDARFFMCSPLLISVLDQLAAARIQVAPRESTFGLAVKTWVTGHGTLNIVKNRLLEGGPTSGQGWGGHGVAVDLNKVWYRPLRGRDTKLETSIQAPDLDGEKDQYKTEMGWQIESEKVHGFIYGVTG